MSTLIVDTDKNGNLYLSFPYHPAVLEAIKEIPSRRWDKDMRVHYIGKNDVGIAVSKVKALGWDVHCTADADVVMQDGNKKKELLLGIKSGGVVMAYDPGLKKPLRPFQQVGLNFLVTAGSCLLGDDMGLGKTAQVIATFKCLKETAGVKKMMVLCPSSVKGGWAADITKFTDLKFQIIEGPLSKRRAQYQNEYDILIMSYDTYLMDFGITKKNTDEHGNRKHEAVPMPDIQVVAADECQRLVRSKNNTTKSLLLLQKQINLKYIYLMTGTPIINRIEDLWSLLYFIDSEIGEFWGFRNRYCEIEYEDIRMLDPKLRKQGKFVKITRKIPKVVGYKNLDELKVKIEPYYIRREKKDVLKDLPEKVFERREIELSTAEREVYNELKDDFNNKFMDIDINMANALTFFVRAKQTCDSLEINDPTTNCSSKLDELKELIDELCPLDKQNNPLPGAHKCVIFSQYKQMTDIIVREFSKYEPIYLHGEVESKDRPFLIDAFQTEPKKYMLFVSTLQAGGVGITLTAADVCIMYDSWWSPSMNNQAMDRLHRIGQINPVLIIKFICRDTVEEHIEKILEKKKLMVEGIFGKDDDLILKLTPEELRKLL